LVGWLVRLSVGPHITSKTVYVVIALRRGEGRGSQLMSKTGYIEIALRLVTVTRSCLEVHSTRTQKDEEIEPIPSVRAQFV
jgi:hypothetical protein